MLPIDNRRNTNMPNVDKAREHKVEAQSIYIAIQSISYINGQRPRDTNDRCCITRNGFYCI